MKVDYVHKDSRTLEEEPQVFTRWIDSTIEELKRENQELKKQLEEYKRLGFKHLNDKCNKLENQQKEFVKYLEYQVKLQEELNDILLATGFEEILSKYRSIVGCDKSVGDKDE